MKGPEHEGVVPFCESCRAYRFSIFGTAISMVTLNPKRNKILTIQQYGKSNNILVAGYVNKEECVEDAMTREMQGEIGRKVLGYRFLRSKYFPKTNTLILNFAVVIDSKCLENVSTWEVGRAVWSTFDKARASIKSASLAQRLLLNFPSVYEQDTEHFFSHHRIVQEEENSSFFFVYIASSRTAFQEI